jgi:threonine dehydrogenase-like Zn-dependent dehydrogenase
MAIAPPLTAERSAESGTRASDRARRDSGPRAHLRHLRDRSQENRDRIALRARIFGHETSGVVAAVGEGVSQVPDWGDRVMVFHHIPCGDCYYCRHKVFAQCETYKKVGARRASSQRGEDSRSMFA